MNCLAWSRPCLGSVGVRSVPLGELAGGFQDVAVGPEGSCSTATRRNDHSRRQGARSRSQVAPSVEETTRLTGALDVPLSRHKLTLG
jgi:hypothetical protein